MKKLINPEPDLDTVPYTKLGIKQGKEKPTNHERIKFIIKLMYYL